MKEGKAVVFVDADGDRHEGTVAKVRDDVSTSGAKVLDIVIPVEGDDPEKHEGIPYVADRHDGQSYWQLTTDPVADE